MLVPAVGGWDAADPLTPRLDDRCRPPAPARGAAVLAVAAVLAGTAGCGFLQDRASGTQRVDGYVVLDRAVTAATPDDRDAVRRRPGGDVRAAGLTPVSR